MGKLKFEPNIWVTFEWAGGVKGIGRTGYVRNEKADNAIIEGVAVVMEDLGTGYLQFAELRNVKKLNILGRPKKEKEDKKPLGKINQSAIVLPYFGEIGEA